MSAEQKREQVRSLVNEIQLKMDDMLAFDGADQIRTYCSDLEAQVLVTVESAVKHLYGVQQQLMRDIDAYRIGRLEAQKQGAVSDDVVDLAGRVQRFKTLWSMYLDEKSVEMTEETVDEAQTKADELLNELSQTNKTLRERALNGLVMKFKPNEVFRLEDDCIGRLEVLRDEVVAHSIQERKHVNLSYATSRCLIKEDVLKSLYFLTNNNVACSSTYNGVGIWDCYQGKLSCSLNTMNTIVSLALLPNGYLACGAAQGFIMLYDLTTSKYKSALTGHTNPVVSMKVVEGRLVSYCSRGTIIVWNMLALPFERLVVLRIEGEQVGATGSQLGVLSNCLLVTCTYENNCTLKVWHSSNGKLVRETNTALSRVTNLLVLANDHVALSSFAGSIKVFDLVAQSVVSSLTVPNAVFYSNTLAQLPNGLLAAGSSSQNTPVFITDPANGQMLQSIPICHHGLVYSMVVSPDGRLLATGSTDRTLKIWTLNYE